MFKASFIIILLSEAFPDFLFVELWLTLNHLVYILTLVYVCTLLWLNIDCQTVATSDAILLFGI